MRADKYKLRPQQELYFALEDADLTFTKNEVEQVQSLYNIGNDEFMIGTWLNRDPDEIHVLLLDLGRKDKINQLRIVHLQVMTANSIAWYLYGEGWSLEDIGREIWG